VLQEKLLCSLSTMSQLSQCRLFFDPKSVYTLRSSTPLHLQTS
jgi:hypothetical protein